MIPLIITGVICFCIGFLIAEIDHLRDLIEFRKFLAKLEDLQRRKIKSLEDRK